jgi:hypothetical protein
LGFATRMMSSVYMACALIAGLRSFDIISNALVPHYKSCFVLKTVSSLRMLFTILIFLPR